MIEIPREYASRPKIFKIIYDAVNKNISKKKADDNDKRKYNLLLASQTLKEF